MELLVPGLGLDVAAPCIIMSNSLPESPVTPPIGLAVNLALDSSMDELSSESREESDEEIKTNLKSLLAIFVLSRFRFSSASFNSNSPPSNDSLLLLDL